MSRTLTRLVAVLVFLAPAVAQAQGVLVVVDPNVHWITTNWSRLNCPWMTEMQESNMLKKYASDARPRLCSL